jgi:hypothetical protein
MFLIRKNPFRPDEDAADFMIEMVNREAAAEGEPLSAEERQQLRAEFNPKGLTFSYEVDQRLRRLVRQVLEREVATGEEDSPRGFSSAIEWAADQEYPLVAHLAIEVCGEHPEWRRERTGWEKFKDGLRCLGCAVVLIIVLGLVSALLTWIFQ